MSCLHGEWLYAAASGRGGVYRVGRTAVPGSDRAGMRSQSVTVGIRIWGLVNDFFPCAAWVPSPTVSAIPNVTRLVKALLI